MPLAVWPLKTAVLGVVVAGACTGEPAIGASIPPAEAYERPPNFAGEWVGEVGADMGTLTVKPLGDGRYYGRYGSEDESVLLILDMVQTPVDVDGASVLANRVVFKWQDGRGGEGQGWLLINREDSALTGASGFDNDANNAGSWAFIRME